MVDRHLKDSARPRRATGKRKFWRHFEGCQRFGRQRKAQPAGRLGRPVESAGWPAGRLAGRTFCFICILLCQAWVGPFLGGVWA